MPYIYSNSEYVDMLLIYGEVGKSNRLAAALYQQRFPHRKSPAPKTFQNVENCMRRTGISQSTYNIKNLVNISHIFF